MGEHAFNSNITPTRYKFTARKTVASTTLLSARSVDPFCTNHSSHSTGKWRSRSVTHVPTMCLCYPTYWNYAGLWHYQNVYMRSPTFREPEPKGPTFIQSRHTHALYKPMELQSVTSRRIQTCDLWATTPPPGMRSSNYVSQMMKY